MVIAKPAAADAGALQMMTRLWALAYGLDVRSKQMAATIGVTGLERLVIRFIGLQPRSTPGMVAARLNMHPTTLRRIVRRLEQRRFVRRLKDPGDRRRSLLVLTARGMRVDHERRGTVEAAVRRTLGRLEPETIHDSAALMGVLVGELLSE